MSTTTSSSTPSGRAPDSQGAPIVSTLSSDPDMLELVQLFVDEIPEKIRTLQDFWQRGELAELRRIAHQIKGASGGYGFPTLGAAAGELERDLNSAVASSDRPDISSLTRRIDELINLCNRVRVA